MVKKVQTFKSGLFVFSSRYDKQKLSGMLAEAKILFATVVELPILPDFASQLEEELIRKSIFGTAAIEGNPLSEEEVEAVLSGSARKAYSRQAEKEIQNLKRVYKIIKEVEVDPSKPTLLSEDLIKTIHLNITAGIDYEDNTPGQYRNHLVKVGNKEHGGVYTPPKILEDIKKLMQEFVLWINSEEILQEDPAIRAALAHYYLGLIHPFGDGNGRTARAVEAFLLRGTGIKFVPHMLSNYYYKNIDDYFWAFSLAERNRENEITPFLEFFLRGVVSSLEEIKGRIVWMIRFFTLEHHYNLLKENKVISQRQYDLLMLLMRYVSNPFSIQELFKEPLLVIYRNVSPRTARRDLEKLTAKNLLEYEGGKHSLNWHLLEQRD